MKKHMKIIIPMTGYGSRFVAAGYKELKPLIRVQGRPIVEWIVKGMYSSSDEFVFVSRKQHLNSIPGMRKTLEGLSENVQIIELDNWKKNGPVFDILRAAELIDDNEPCVVNYCDLFVRWDWMKIQSELQQRDCEGAIICWSGFNPTTLPVVNVFASCKVDDSGNLVEIREKYDFERDRTKGHFSAGIYYFKTGSIMKKAFQDCVDAEDMVNGEYYASLPYNYMVEKGMKVWVKDCCETFCNWGTPEDMQDYLFWMNSMDHVYKKINVLIPMAGAGQRFVNAGYKIHKPLLPTVDRKTGMLKPMVCCAVSDLPGIDREQTNLIFVDRSFHKEDGVEEQIKEYYPKARFITAAGLTDGQACTCLLAKEMINNNDELLISACDNGLEMDVKKFNQLKQECDVIVFTYKSNITRSNPNAYGWIRVDDNDNVLDVSCKRAISDTPEKDNAVVATFWFRKGKIFVKAAEKMIAENDRINNEFYVDQVVRHTVEMGYKVKIFPVDKYICWGTPEDYEGYNNTIQYWNNFYTSEIYRSMN